MSERTKLWIANTMKELMKTNSLDKIHVTDICEKAEIKRPTFYYHFKDKYDLVAWIFYNSTSRSNMLDKSDSVQFLNEMKANIIFYKRAYEDYSQNPLWSYMVSYFTEGYISIAKSILQADVLEEQIIFDIKLYCYGGVAMTKEWVLNDNITSAEKEVDMLFMAMPAELKEIFNLKEILKD